MGSTNVLRHVALNEVWNDDPGPERIVRIFHESFASWPFNYATTLAETYIDLVDFLTIGVDITLASSTENVLRGLAIGYDFNPDNLLRHRSACQQGMFEGLSKVLVDSGLGTAGLYFIDAVATEPACRGNGAGKALFEYQLGVARRRHAKRALMWTSERYEANGFWAMLSKLGFAKVGYFSPPLLDHRGVVLINELS